MATTANAIRIFTCAPSCCFSREGWLPSGTAHSTSARRWREYDERRILRGLGSITARDAALLLDVVHEGAADDGLEPFPSSALRALARLIPSDAFVGYEEADFTGRAIEIVQIVGDPVTPALEAAFDAYSWQNPMRGREHTQDQDVLRLSDLLTRPQRRKLEFEAIVWGPNGIDDALRFWMPAPPGRARSIYVERSGDKYTTRDVTLLSLLRPHFIRIRANAASRRRINGRDGLTAREAEVLGWVARGKTNADIGNLLFISPHTVRKHIENIFEKLNVQTRTAAAAHVRARPG